MNGKSRHILYEEMAKRNKGRAILVGPEAKGEVEVGVITLDCCDCMQRLVEEKKVTIKQGDVWLHIVTLFLTWGELWDAARGKGSPIFLLDSAGTVIRPVVDYNQEFRPPHGDDDVLSKSIVGG